MSATNHELRVTNSLGTHFANQNTVTTEYPSYITYLDMGEDMFVYEPWTSAAPEFAPLARPLAMESLGRETLRGKTVLVEPEGRVEDEILCANYYQHLLDLAGQVVIRCSTSLLGLLTRSFPKAICLDANLDPARELGKTCPVPDYHVPARALAQRLRRQVEMFLDQRCLLQADPEKVGQWQGMLPDPRPKTVIGVFPGGEWEGTGQLADAWAPLFSQPGVFCFVNLNPALQPEEVNRLQARHASILTPGLSFSPDDLETLATVCRICDVVISSSLPILTLAAAVGVPAWAARSRGWAPGSTVAPPWHPTWPGHQHHQSSQDPTMRPKAICLARFHTPWGLPQRTTPLDWLRLSQDPEYQDDILTIQNTSVKELAQLHARKGHPDRAQELLAREYAVNATIQDGYAELGLLHSEKNDWQAALPLLLKDYKQQRLSPRGHIHLAETLARLDNASNQEALVENAYAQDRTLLNGYARLGWVKYEATDYQGALSLLLRDYKQGKLSPQWQLKLAESLGQVGDFESAEAVVERAYQEDGRLKDGFARVGWIKHQAGDFQGALVLFRKDEALERLSSQWQLKLAETLGQVGDFESAEAVVERAYQEDGRLKDGFARVGWQKMLYPIKDFIGAEKLILKDVRANRLTPDWHYKLCNLKAIQGDLKSALNILDEIYTNEPMPMNEYGRFGWFVYILNGDVDFFKKMLDRDVALNKSSPNNSYQALFAAASGSFAKAEEIIMELIQDNQKAKDLRTVLGWLYLRNINAQKSYDLMIQDFNENRMSLHWYPVFTLVLNTQGFKNKAMDVLELCLNHRKDSDLIQIGSQLVPDAIISCSDLRKFVEQGYGYGDIISVRKH